MVNLCNQLYYPNKFLELIQCQVREQLSAASLGLPRRIRDEDCDVEPLTPSDLEEDSDESIADLFGSCKSEHVVYVIKMVQIARLRKDHP